MFNKKVFQYIIIMVFFICIFKYFDLNFNLCRKILKVVLSLIFISNILLCNDDYDDCNEDECSLKNLDLKNAKEFAKIQADILERIEGDQTTKIINMVYDIESDEDCNYNFTFWGIIKDILIFILKSFYNYIVIPFLYFLCIRIIHELNFLFEAFIKLDDKTPISEKLELLYTVFFMTFDYILDKIKIFFKTGKFGGDE